MKKNKDITTFDELLDHEYGPIGTESRNEYSTLDTDQDL
jgi:hypothetical protein